MSDMICSRCHRYGMYWQNLTGLSPYTYCPHCQSRQLPVPQVHDMDDTECDDVWEEP